MKNSGKSRAASQPQGAANYVAVRPEDLAEGEEVLLPDAQGVLPDGVGEGPGVAGREVLEGVDAEAVDVVPPDDVLIDPDQGGLEVGVSGQELLEGVEVALDMLPVGEGSLPPEELVPA